MSSDNDSSKNGFLGFLWRTFFPVYKSEVKVVAAMSLMLIIKVFIYTSVRQLKDTLVVTKIGPEALSFTKTLVLVMSLLFTFLYALGISKFDRRQLFYIVLIVFIGFFGFFGFFMHPNSHLFILSEASKQGILNWLSGGIKNCFFSVQNTIKIFSIGILMGLFKFFKKRKIKDSIISFIITSVVSAGIYSLFYALSGPSFAHKLALPVATIQYWPYALYYIMAELWGTFSLQMLFWTFANYQIDKSNASRIFPTFLLLCQFGQFGAGILGFTVAGGSLEFIVTISVVLLGIVAGLLHEYVFKTTGREKSGSAAKLKQKASMKDSLKAVLSSPVVLMISLIVIMYGISCNFLEMYWKKMLSDYARLVNPAQHKALYHKYYSLQNTITSVISFISALIGGKLFRKFSWTFVALITPMVMGIGSILFYGSDIFGISLGLASLSTILKFVVIVGASVLILFKATKYTLFDSTKEYLMVRVDDNIKSQGKLADSFCGRLGKSGGATIQAFLITSCGGYTMPLKWILFSSTMLFFFIWLISVFKLSKYARD